MKIKTQAYSILGEFDVMRATPTKIYIARCIFCPVNVFIVIYSRTFEVKNITNLPQFQGSNSNDFRSETLRAQFFSTALQNTLAGF